MTKTRVSTLDQAPSNKRWRRVPTSSAALLGEEAAGWEHIEIDCRLRIDQNNRVKVLNISQLKLTIAGHNQYSQCFEDAAPWESYQACLWQFVYDDVVICYGSPSLQCGQLQKAAANIEFDPNGKITRETHIPEHAAKWRPQTY